jgi:hypothetical protein
MVSFAISLTIKTTSNESFFIFWSTLAGNRLWVKKVENVSFQKKNIAELKNQFASLRNAQKS